MKRIDAQRQGGGFHVLVSTDHGQAASMVLNRGGSTGGPENKHVRADQWLYVVSGSGAATVSGKDVDLGPGTLLLIEAGETHEVRASDSEDLVTLNIYSPPAY